MSFQEELFKTIDIIIKGRINKTPYTYTIQGTIIDQVTNRNVFNIMYQGQKIQAHGNGVYNAGRVVDILVTNTRFSDKKYILSTPDEGIGGASNELIEMPNTTMNQSLSCGSYRFLNPTSGYPSGYTSNSEFIMEVRPLESEGTNWHKQILYDAKSDRIFDRTENNSIYSEWQEIQKVPKNYEIVYDASTKSISFNFK